MLKVQAIVFAQLLFVAGVASAAEPVIPGLAANGLAAEIKGQVLIEELNCVACHAAEGTLAERSKKAPRLADIGARMHPAFLEAFIGDPHGIKPGTTMPDAMATLGAEEKPRAAQALTHFLLSRKAPDFAPQAPDLVAAKSGHRLFQSRGCAACHAPRDEQAAELPMANSVPLGALDGKYSHRSLVEFLRQPHASRPSGRMPDMRLQGRDAESIAHFLLQKTRVPGALRYTLYRGQVWEGLEGDGVAAARGGQVEDFALSSLGRVERHTAVRYEGWLNVAAHGTHKFFLTMNGGSLVVDGQTLVQQPPSDRRGVKDFTAAVELAAGPHAMEFTYFHTGREPKLTFEMQGPQLARGPVLAAMLSAFKEPVAPFVPLKVDTTLAQRGREYFGKLGCANCHDDLKVPGLVAPAFAKIDAARGCLGDAAGPRFGLSAPQRDLIKAALPTAAHPVLDDKQQLNKTLVTFNCIACHERTGLGGIAPERNANFTGTHEALGDQGRIPPPLSHVGAKLKPEWIAEVLLRGKRQRDYLDASMPQFGEANVGHLANLFGKVDTLEAVNFPKVANIQESKNAGYEMIGSNGFSCIACHDFNGQKSGGAGALDIVNVTERIQKNWFHLYMRQPSRFHPTVIMPSYWPGGQSIRPTILGGDTAQQIEALWTYLEDGTRAKKPVGLSRQSSELRVGDVAEICRGRGPAGYRGIGVGYVERISLAFDSEEMTLRELWKGEFANVDLGSFRSRGTDRIAFPAGVPFHRLKSLEDNWPYKSKTNYAFPQDHGYQFRGYHLDVQRRPTFLYRYGDIAVEDFFEDVRGKDGKAYFKRTFQFDAPDAQPPFYFRAASGKTITPQSERAFAADALQLRITSEHQGIVREGNPDEVLIPLTLPKGRSTLTLEYQW